MMMEAGHGPDCKKARNLVIHKVVRAEILFIIKIELQLIKIKIFIDGKQRSALMWF